MAIMSIPGQGAVANPDTATAGTGHPTVPTVPTVARDSRIACAELLDGLGLFPTPLNPPMPCS